jgi:hypothetical protein
MSAMAAAMCSAVSSYPPNSLGSPALGWVLTSTGATRARSWTNGAIRSTPRAQFSPTERGRACITEYQKASTVWPDRVRPLRSVMVPEIITGRRTPVASATSSIAKSAALAFRVSKMVSTSSRSAPPSISPRAASP